MLTIMCMRMRMRVFVKFNDNVNSSVNANGSARSNDNVAFTGLVPVHSHVCDCCDSFVGAPFCFI